MLKVVLFAVAGILIPILFFCSGRSISFCRKVHAHRGAHRTATTSNLARLHLFSHSYLTAVSITVFIFFLYFLLLFCYLSNRYFSLNQQRPKPQSLLAISSHEASTPLFKWSIRPAAGRSHQPQRYPRCMTERVDHAHFCLLACSPPVLHAWRHNFFAHPQGNSTIRSLHDTLLPPAQASSFSSSHPPSPIRPLPTSSLIS